jgi:hypothetical protein
MAIKVLVVVQEEGPGMRTTGQKLTTALMASKVLVVVHEEGVGSMKIQWRTMKIIIQHKDSPEEDQALVEVVEGEAAAGIITGGIRR